MTLYWFEQVFSNKPVSASRPFGPWLLWGYGIWLLTTLIPRTDGG
ncbi:DUF5367 family protein [Mastigocladopsis repens]|nr:DUF5367 family protein [Mastigocladopsis repens]